MLRVIIGVFLATVVPLVLQRFMSSAPEWSWRVLAFACVALGLAFVASSGVIYPYLRDYNRYRIVSTVITAGCAAIIVAAFWLFLVIKFNPSASKAGENLRGSVIPPMISGDTPKGASIILLLDIINSGPSTIATGFNATIKIDNKVVNLPPVYLPIGTIFDFPGRGSSTIKPSEMMFSKLPTRIPSGGKVDGFLFYIVDGITADELWKHASELTIYFRDAWRNEYHVVAQPLEGPPPKLHVPGVENPFLPFIGDSPTPPSSTPSTGASPP